MTPACLAAVAALVVLAGVFAAAWQHDLEWLAALVAGAVLGHLRGRPTLIDFGASRAAMVGRTTAMTAVFTPGYAAAEQMTSAKQRPWTDIYGLSATLYHAIAGAPPPPAFDRMLDDDYAPLSKLSPAGLPANVLVGIDAGLAVRAAERPQTIAPCYEQLHHLVGHDRREW